MNIAQTIAAQAYENGELAHFVGTPEQAGDTLFLFLMRELSDQEDCEDLAMAVSRVAAAIQQLQEAHQALLYQVQLPKWIVHFRIRGDGHMNRVRHYASIGERQGEWINQRSADWFYAIADQVEQTGILPDKPGRCGP